jgi:hypothetical protein
VTSNEYEAVTVFNFFLVFLVFLGVIFLMAFVAFLAIDFAALTTRLVTDFFLAFFGRGILLSVSIFSISSWRIASQSSCPRSSWRRIS